MSLVVPDTHVFQGNIEVSLTLEIAGKLGAVLFHIKMDKPKTLADVGTALQRNIYNALSTAIREIEHAEVERTGK